MSKNNTNTFPGPLPLFLEMQTALKKSSSVRPIKSIGIFYSHYFEGGLQRVISCHIPMFIGMGYKVVLITEQYDPDREFPLPKAALRELIPSSYEMGRLRSLKNIVKRHKLDLYIDHSAFYRKTFIYDALLMKSLDVKVLMFAHRVHTAALHDAHFFSYYIRPVSFNLADRLIVLTHMDEDFYKSIGVNATYMPNPIELAPHPTMLHSENPHVLWIGRLQDSSKNFGEALEIFKRLINRNSNLVCDLVGPEVDKNSGRKVSQFISMNHFENRLIWHGMQKDVRPFYERATIQLCTSLFESFSMAIAEGKSFGVPLVTYDLPYLELLRDKKGYLAVTPHDIDGAVTAVERILRDKILAERLSEEAVESVKKFSDLTEQAPQWEQLFKKMENEENIILTAPQKNMRLFLQTSHRMIENGALSFF